MSSTALSIDVPAEISQTAHTVVPPADSRSETFHRRKVYLLALGHLVNDSYTGYLSPLLPILMEQMKFPLSRAGILASVLSASTSLLQPIYGTLNDRLGRRFFVFLGPLISGIFICSLGYVPSYWLLIPLLIICGTGSATFHPSAAALVNRLSGPRKEWGMSLFVTAGNWGHSLAPLLAVPVVTHFGLKALPLMVFPAMFVSLLLFKRLPKSDGAAVHFQRLSFSEETNSRLRPLFLHLIISMLRSLLILGFGNFLPLYMRSQGHSFFLSGATTTVFLSVGSIGALMSGHLAARADRRRIIFFSLLAAMPLLLSFIFFSGILSLFALGASGILLYFSFPLNIVMAQELFPQRASTVAAMMIGLSWGTAGLMMTPLGFFAEKVGLQTALLILTVAGLFAATAASFLPKDSARVRREHQK